ncbi:Uncharacterised protein r2_g1244 [Pycnogonum litorale]
MEHLFAIFIRKTAHHGSHFDIVIDQRLSQDYQGYSLAYYRNSVQNLVVSSFSEDRPVFYVYTTLAKSHYFILNNLQSPVDTGSAILVEPVPHAYPDDMIAFFNFDTKNVEIFNQDINLRFHGNFEHSINSDIIDLDFLVLRQSGTLTEVLMLFLSDGNVSTYGYILTIDVGGINKSTDVLIECIKELKTLVEERKDSIRYLEENIERVFVTNRGQNVTSTVIINGFTNVTGSTFVHNLVIAASNGSVSNITNSELLEDILDCERQVDAAENESSNVVYKSTDQKITGQLTIYTDVNIVEGKFDEIKTDVVLNGENVTRYRDHTLKTVGNQTINNPLTITGNLTVQGNLMILDRLNHVLIDQYVLTIGDQVLNGHYTFNTDIVLDTLNVDTINGIPPEYLVLTTGFQTIDGVKTFDEITVSNIEVLGNTNGQDLSDFTSRVLTLDKDHVITGHYILHSLNVTEDIELDGLISGEINVTDLHENVVDIESDQTINGSITFLNKLHIAGNLTAGHVNGVNTDELITLNTVQNITGDFTIDGVVYVLNNITVDVVNKIPVTDWVPRLEDFNITGHKIFNQSIHVNGNIIMDESVTIDGVDPSELTETSVFIGGNINILGSTTINSLVVLGDVIFESDVNDIFLSYFLNHIWRKSVEQVINVPVITSPHVTFEGDLFVTGDINGYNLEDDYIHVFGNETITGHVLFKQDVYVSGDVKIPDGVTINGYDISELSNKIVRINGPAQEITGQVYFTNIFMNDANVIVNSTVNGFDLSQDFLDLRSNQTVFTELYFSYKYIGCYYLFADVITLPPGGTVNGVIISEFAKDVIFVNETLIRPISGKVFDKLIVNDLSIDGLINGINFNFFIQNVVTLSTDQEVAGQKIFAGHTFFEWGLYIDYLNGIEFTPYALSVINKTATTLVTGSKTVQGTIYIDGDIIMQPNKTVNGFDVSELGDRVLLHSKDQNVTGIYKFNTTTVYIKYLEIPYDLLDGVRLDNVALTTENTTLYGNIEFDNTLHVLGNLTVKGLVNGCNLYGIIENAIRLHTDSGGPQTIYGYTIIDQLIVQGNITLLDNRTVNNIDISELADELVTTIGDRNVTGEFIFMESVIVKNLEINDLINGKNISFLLTDAVFRNESQIIDGKKTFEQDVHAWTVHVENDVDVTTTVNGVDLSYLANHTVYKDSDRFIWGNKIINSVNATDIYVNGTVNGINIPDDVWLVNTSDTLPGKTEFVSGSTDSITVDGNLQVGGLIDGRNLSELIDGRVTLSSNQTITAHLIFLDHVIVRGDCFINGSINGINPDDIVKTSGNYTIDGPKEFTSVLHINGNLSVELINGVDIVELSNAIVRRDSPAVINSTTIFNGQVRFESGLIVNGLIDGIDVSVLAELYFLKIEELTNQLKNLTQRLDDQIEWKHFILDGIEGQTVIPSHFHKVDWKDDFEATEFFPTEFDNKYGNVKNPSAFYGSVPRSDCAGMPECRCTESCQYILSGPNISMGICEFKNIFNICSGTKCFKFSSMSVSASETCVHGILNGRFDDLSNALSVMLLVPTITDVTLIQDVGGVILFVVAIPSDGNQDLSAKLYKLDGAVFTTEPDLPRSVGVHSVHSFSVHNESIIIQYVAAAGRNSVHLYVYDETTQSLISLDDQYFMSQPSGLLTIKTYENDTFLVVGSVINDAGFLMQEAGPNLRLYEIIDNKLRLKQEVFTGSIYHMTLMHYAGDIYVVTTQTDDDRVTLFRLQGHKLVDVNINIPVVHPTSTLASYYRIEEPPSPKANITKTTELISYQENEMLLFILAQNKLSVLRTVQFGNGINLETAKP